MGGATNGFKMDTLERKKVEKFRRKERDARIHRRLSALLWLNAGRSVLDVADLLDVCPRTIENWVARYQSEGLDALCTLQYQGDPG